jgi:Zn-dependent metalloprotease
MTFCSIVPPYILANIAMNGSRRQTEWALQQLADSERIRGRRELMPAFTFAAPVTAVKQRTVYDAESKLKERGRVVRTEKDPATDDIAVNEAFDYSGVTWDFFYELFERNSIDGAGMRLDSTVHYGTDYPNAFWNGAQMVYGDGDGEIFGRFTQSLDVIAHELTHGVTQYEAALAYQDEAGALNEHFSDVFGSLVKQRFLKQTAGQADWLIGAQLLIPEEGTVRLAIRSMAAPGTAYDDPVMGRDPQPAHMDDFVETQRDHGGVHINSGIPNKAFHLFSTRVGGNAWEVAGKIWYTTLCNRLRATTTFRQCAAQTVSVALEDFSKDVAATLLGAWKDVGIRV